MSQLKRENGAQQEPLNEILNRVGSECRDVAVLIERLEPMFSGEKIASVMDAHEQMNLLQGVDLAVQKAQGLADFLESISTQMDANHLVEIATALNLITLSDLKKRLASADQEKEMSADHYQKASGDLDFF